MKITKIQICQVLLEKFQTEYKQRQGQNINYKDSRKALECIDSYSIYKQVKEKFPTMTIDHKWVWIC